MTLTSGGFLGVGVASPTQTIETVGNIFINAASGNPDLTIKTAGTGNNPSVAYRAGDNVVFDNMLVASASTDYWRVGYGSSGSVSDELLAVLSTGNVGIGTTSPNYSLDVDTIGHNSTGEILLTGGNSASNDYTQTALLKLRGTSINPNQPSHDANSSVAEIRLNHADLSGNASSGNITFHTNPGNNINGALAERMVIGASETVVNEASNDYNFRVESNGNTHAIFVDAGNDRVGILESSPGGPLEVAADGGASCINMIGRDNSSSDEAALQFIDHNGSTANAMIINSGQSIAFFTGGTSTETARFSAERNLHLGTTATLGVSGGGIRQGLGSGETDGDTYFVAQGGGSNATPFVLEVVSQNLYDSGTTAMKVGRHSGNARSISAGGSINASGADYAEYMKKADACGTIAKGDVCGVDSTGKLTDVFSNSISFVIKSTDPSYVGGDIWGSVELNLTEEQYEAERQKHDRIAFSGQVPVNITGSFNVGDYVYPQANGSGIQCVAKSNPTFEEYQLCVGKIWATESDGRPLVAVKIG
jgi:hypothetical protein